MTVRARLLRYIQANLVADFDDDAHALTDVLDSLSLLQLVTFIDYEMGISVDLAQLTRDMFSSLDALVSSLETAFPEGG